MPSCSLVVVNEGPLYPRLTGPMLALALSLGLWATIFWVASALLSFAST
jgi:hypothetical protein